MDETQKENVKTETPETTTGNTEEGTETTEQTAADKINAEAEEIEKANQRLANAKAVQQMGGQSAGIQEVVPKKVLTNIEYKNEAMAGRIPK